MSPEAILAILSGLTALVTAVGTILLNRQQREKKNMEQLKKDFAVLQKRILAYQSWAFILQQELAKRNIDVPPAPVGLDDEED